MKLFLKYIWSGNLDTAVCPKSKSPILLNITHLIITVFSKYWDNYVHGLCLRLLCWFSGQMTWYLQSLVHPFSLRRTCNQSRDSVRASWFHILSFTALKKQQSQSWRTASLQSPSGINRFDPYWKSKGLWDGGLGDIRIAEEADMTWRRGGPEPRMRTNLAVMVTERYAWFRAVWMCCFVLLHVSAPHCFTKENLSGNVKLKFWVR